MRVNIYKKPRGVKFFDSEKSEEESCGMRGHKRCGTRTLTLVRKYIKKGVNDNETKECVRMAIQWVAPVYVSPLRRERTGMSR